MVHTVDSYVYPLDSSATLYNEPNFSAEVLEQCQEETDALVAATNGELTGAGGDVSNPIKNRLRVAKCIVVGDISVGKTCLINRFGYNVFTDDYKTTIGVDFDVQKFDILKRPFSLQIWDTAGQDRFRQITRTYYRGAHAALIVFDLSNMSSFRNVQHWLREILDSVNSGGERPFLFLVGTKMDLLSEDTKEFFRSEGAKMANQIEAEYWMVSSTSGENVQQLFYRVACLCFNQYICKEIQTQRNFADAAVNANSPVRYSSRNGGCIAFPGALCNGSNVNNNNNNVKRGQVANVEPPATSAFTKHLFVQRLMKLFRRQKSNSVSPSDDSQSLKKRKKTFHCFSLSCTFSVED